MDGIGVRAASEAEKREIFDAMVRETDYWRGIEEKEDAWERLKAAQVAVIESYIPDSPGWIGDLYLVVWGAGTERITYCGRGKDGMHVIYDGELQAK